MDCYEVQIPGILSIPTGPLIWRFCVDLTLGDRPQRRKREFTMTATTRTDDGDDSREMVTDTSTGNMAAGPGQPQTQVQMPGDAFTTSAPPPPIPPKSSHLVARTSGSLKQGHGQSQTIPQTAQDTTMSSSTAYELPGTTGENAQERGIGSNATSATPPPECVAIRINTKNAN